MSVIEILDHQLGFLIRCWTLPFLFFGEVAMWFLSSQLRVKPPDDLFEFSVGLHVYLNISFNVVLTSLETIKNPCVLLALLLQVHIFSHKQVKFLFKRFVLDEEILRFLQILIWWWFFRGYRWSRGGSCTHITFLLRRFYRTSHRQQLIRNMHMDWWYRIYGSQIINTIH